MNSNPDTSALVLLASQGDRRAAGELLARHRTRLKRVVLLRLDPRLAGRFDPSDIVQDVLAEASQKLVTDLPHSELRFYPWLRQLALDRLSRLHRDHIRLQKRTVRREERLENHLPDRSALLLADRLLADQTSPSGQVIQQEQRQRLLHALSQLPDAEREVLQLRFLEQLSTAETADVMRSTVSAVKSRQFRAIQKLQRLMDCDEEEAT